ncbi:MAG: hypothetical protein AAFO69_21880, partial [Bacteroidota bacterium]
MKKALFLILFVISINLLFTSCDPDKSGDSQKFQVEALTAFAKLYGYVKYFHPSDEAQKIDWDKFAIYGADKVLKCKSQTELAAELRNLFLPVAPTLKVYTSEAGFDFEEFERVAQPTDTSKLKLAYWQHKGLGRGMNFQDDIYRSVRVNRPTIVENRSRAVSIQADLDPLIFADKKVRFSGWLKFEPYYFSWVTPFLTYQQAGENVKKVNGSTFKYPDINEWLQFEVEVDTLKGLDQFNIGFRLFGKGKVFFDDLMVE